MQGISNELADWDLDSLNQAYQQGYMAGLSLPDDVDPLSPKAPCPELPEVVAAAWEAGWQDGYEQWLQRREAKQAFPQTA